MAYDLIIGSGPGREGFTTAPCLFHQPAEREGGGDGRGDGEEE
jgi:hypothetical protein